MSTLNPWLKHTVCYQHITIKFSVALERFRNGKEEKLNVSYHGFGTIFICGSKECYKYRQVTVPADSDNGQVESRLRGLLKQFKSQGWTVTEASFE